MRIVYLLLALALFLFSGCAPKPVPPVAVAATEKQIDYVEEVQPLLNRRCVVCHSCYNAPCQLKMSAYEGITRGATKKGVYDTDRLEAAAPTRLFIDAQNPLEWHEKYDFYGVTESSAAPGFNNSTMISLLEAKRKEPISYDDYKPEEDELVCPRNHGEVEEYLDEHPERGMPYGFPELTPDEFSLIAAWLQQGAKGPNKWQQAALTTPSKAAGASIATWEAFLNQSDPKHVMTARYLYEHLFLAHIQFESAKGEYFELLRSRTPSGEPVDVIPTVRPYDDPGGPFYYRFRKIHSTIVHKTHMVFTLSPTQLERVTKNFIEAKWAEKPHVMCYDPITSANPFVTFAQIPALARYRFMLDHSEYIIRTFIRGPVCKGQVALNVINDQFWVVFLDPAYDLSLKHPNLISQHVKELEMPIDEGSNYPLGDILSDCYIDKAINFYKARDKFYATYYTDGLGYDAIWKGAEADDAPLLTIYRHFDSASVQKGALGNLPKTLWVIDYPLFERIYYALVAGYDVFGNIAHQTNERRYMDRLRVEGESYYLNFMPNALRKGYFAEWNQNMSFLVKEKMFYEPSKLPTAIRFKTDDPKREFVETLIEKHFLPETGIQLDPVNYFRACEPYPQLPKQYRSRADYIQAFRALSKPGTGFIRRVVDYNANLAYVRVRMPEGREDVCFSIVVNRWHDNVAFMFDESRRLDPAKDTLNFVFDFIGSYPNLFFDFPVEQAPEFFDVLMHYDDSDAYRRKLLSLIVTREKEGFWQTYDWFQDRFDMRHPIQSGLFDLNRYYYHAFSPEDTKKEDGEF